MSKISELSTLLPADYDPANDYVPIVDASAGTTKKILGKNLAPSGSPTVAHNIASLCTSNYTILTCSAKDLGNGLCRIYAVLNNGSDGIPKSVDGVRDLLTLPSTLFNAIHFIADVTSNSSSDNSQIVTAVKLPLYIQNISIKARAFTDNDSFISPRSLMSNGNLNCLVLFLLASKRPGVELP